MDFDKWWKEKIKDNARVWTTLEKLAARDAWDEIASKAIPSLDLLQTRLGQGSSIVLQGDMWMLFDEDGELICSGDTIRKMMINLIFTDG